MSVIILGGNKRMERIYTEICENYQCKAKVITEKPGGIREIGQPDLLVMFTSTVSHKLLQSTLGRIKEEKTKIVRCHSASVTALKKVLEDEGCVLCQKR